MFHLQLKHHIFKHTSFIKLYFQETEKNTVEFGKLYKKTKKETNIGKYI